MEAQGSLFRELTASRPSPTDFDEFLPWACAQLNVEADIIISRSTQTQYVSAAVSARKQSRMDRIKSTIRPLSDPIHSDSISTSKIEVASSVDVLKHGKPIYIDTIYDMNMNLVQLKFRKNTAIPQAVMKIIGLIISFHTSLTSITIDSGLRVGTVYEMSKLLPISRITTMCLDNTHFIEANYHVLLNSDSLQNLSLAKCKLNDDVIKTIAAKLQFPESASKTLSVLNLATNRITDLGAQYLADALRANRHLVYLNLADNRITDVGATSLFNSLSDFALTEPEKLDRKIRLMTYLNKKQELMVKTVKELQSGKADKKLMKLRRPTKPQIPTKKVKTLEKEMPDLVETSETTYFDRAKVIAEDILGPFKDPYGPEHTEKRNDEVYCFGNNTLCYLNLAYNNLTYFSVKKLHEVILKQQLNDREPKGLIKIIIEGNLMPADCTELRQIDKLLGSALDKLRCMPDSSKKKPVLSKRM